ncbi:urokinase plasminogen activator surface receptor isoform X14 [Homo sapiens]|uniref:urokinase plasminogen activator surface receptor isoform X14 n=1 Tax=Homo sapiens TaxID=9606 RepID=UPI001FB078CF|nr:urokinase plasminogen activator surface receptor isoform X14 [Homo sapiens]XP_054177193.1 urokinase plasminogen activator surface receptor isoform X14 [Homo sapiens]
MGHPPLLPLLLLLHTCVPASWGLRCMQCKTNGDCRVEECALGQDLCRTTIVRLWEGRAVTYSRSRYLECISCGSSDMSCERGRHQSLQCRSPEEQCLDVVTHWIQEGEEVLELENLPQNGRQCYSCKGNSTHGCSSEETFLIDCRGPMNQCLVATGTHERSLWGSWLPCKSTTALRPPCCEEAQATHV